MPDAFFTFSSLGTVTVAAAAVVVVSNTLRTVTRWDSPVLPFLVSLLVAFSGATVANQLIAWPDYLLAFLNACLLFCTSTGAQEVVVEGKTPRSGGQDNLQSSRPSIPWLSSWLRGGRT